MWQTVCQVYQHADERHDLPVGREHGRLETYSRSARRDGRCGKVGRTNTGTVTFRIPKEMNTKLFEVGYSNGKNKMAFFHLNTRLEMPSTCFLRKLVQQRCTIATTFCMQFEKRGHYWEKLSGATLLRRCECLHVATS